MARGNGRDHSWSKQNWKLKKLKNHKKSVYVGFLDGKLNWPQSCSSSAVEKKKPHKMLLFKAVIWKYFIYIALSRLNKLKSRIVYFRFAHVNQVTSVIIDRKQKGERSAMWFLDWAIQKTKSRRRRVQDPPLTEREEEQGKYTLFQPRLTYHEV